VTTSTRRPRTLALLAVLVSTGGTLLLVELVLRIASGTPFSVPDPHGEIHMVTGAYPGRHDDLVGYVPEPGPAPDNAWGTTVTILPDTLRSNGPAPRPSGEPILVVGDSFTFGDEVSDHETWPARLEVHLERPVLNGGVFGYGLDQMLLRSERLLARTGARTLVVSFTADDVHRCEYAYRYAWKPWFAVVGGGLELRGVPVPAPDSAPPGEPLWRRALRPFFLADLVMRRLDPEHWLLPDSLRVHRQGIDVGRRLVNRLADSAAEGGHTLLLVHQWHPLSATASAVSVIDHAAERGVAVLRTEPLLRRAIARHPQGPQGLFNIDRSPGSVAVGHMTPEGYDSVARMVARRLELGP